MLRRSYSRPTSPNAHLQYFERRGIARGAIEGSLLLVSQLSIGSSFRSSALRERVSSRSLIALSAHCCRTQAARQSRLLPIDSY